MSPTSTSIHLSPGAVVHPDVPAARVLDTLSDRRDQVLTVSISGGVRVVKLDPVPVP